MSGWIKLHRKITDWEGWDDHNTTRLFIYLITKANHRDKSWRGIEIKRGQFISSLDKLVKETGISSQRIRTALKRLKATNEITSESTSQYTKYIVNNYDLYQYDQQENNTPDNKQLTHNQQTNNIQSTTTNNVKKEKKDKNVNKSLDSIESNGKMTLIQHFGKGFKDYFGSDYHAKFGKDGQLLNQLSDQYGEEKVISGINYFFNTYLLQDEFAMENPSVGTFSMKWNSMISKSSGKRALTKQQKKVQSSIENIVEVDLD